MEHRAARKDSMEKRNRSLLVLLTHCLTAAFAAGLAFALVVAAATFAFARARSFESSAGHLNSVSATQQFSGMITDSQCGARHATDSGKSPAECARECVRRGSKYVLVDGDVSYTLAGNRIAIDRLAGQRAQVQGILDGDILTVTSATAQ